MLDLSGRTAVVTGGGKGIGRSIATALAGAGAHAAILDIDEDAGRDAVRKVASAGGSATFHSGNVSRRPEVERICAEIMDARGRIDILINNAGVAHIGTVETTTDEDFDRLVAVNVKGVFNCLRTVVPIMKAHGGGVIVNIASVAAHVGLPDRFLYSLTKAAVLNMTVTVARDYVSDNIRCNSISPARVHTPFVDGYLARTYPGRETEMFEKLSKTQPIGRMAEPEEIGALALYLCSDEASFITGTDYPIDGGFLRLNT